MYGPRKAVSSVLLSVYERIRLTWFLIRRKGDLSQSSRQNGGFNGNEETTIPYQIRSPAFEMCQMTVSE